MECLIISGADPLIMITVMMMMIMVMMMMLANIGGYCWVVEVHPQCFPTRRLTMWRQKSNQLRQLEVLPWRSGISPTKDIFQDV